MTTQTYAQLVNVHDTGVTLNGDPQVGLDLRVFSPQQPTYTLQLKTIVPRGKVAQVRAGALVPLTVDSADLTRITLHWA